MISKILRPFTWGNKLLQNELNKDISDKLNVLGNSVNVPYYIPPIATFLIPEYSQVLFNLDIKVDGNLIIDGFLVEVS